MLMLEDIEGGKPLHDSGTCNEHTCAALEFPILVPHPKAPEKRFPREGVRFEYVDVEGPNEGGWIRLELRCGGPDGAMHNFCVIYVAKESLEANGFNDVEELIEDARTFKDSSRWLVAACNVLDFKYLLDYHFQNAHHRKLDENALAVNLDVLIQAGGPTWELEG